MATEIEISECLRTIIDTVVLKVEEQSVELMVNENKTPRHAIDLTGLRYLYTSSEYRKLKQRATRQKQKRKRQKTQKKNRKMRLVMDAQQHKDESIPSFLSVVHIMPRCDRKRCRKSCRGYKGGAHTHSFYRCYFLHVHRIHVGQWLIRSAQR